MKGKTDATLAPAVLRKFPLFSPFSEDQLGKIAETALLLSITADTVVFRQGEDSGAMYMILEGAVKVEYEDLEGGTIAVGDLCRYESFGEIAMLSREPLRVTVRTTADSEFLVIDRDLLLGIIRTSAPEEIIAVLSALSEQIRQAQDRESRLELLHRTLALQMEVEKQRALTQMVAGVAHEINTPLGVINTAVSIMARELASPQEMTIQRAADIAESLEVMRRNVERAHRLVQEFKKISVSQLADEKESFDIVAAIEDTVELVMVNLRRSQISVNFNNRLPSEQQDWTGYRGILSQILINLLTNIERHAYPNGAGGVAEIMIDLKDDTQFVLTVRDNGEGIPKENQPRIFEPFFTTKRSNGGTGLGLAIVHNLVTSTLKGDIQLSEAGKGAEFIVTFPRVILD
ncbi:MAG: ATP-binding protein [Anaerolineales bacterium]|nr:MAG: ATP-binding protein [Anaerolineales bacterium]